jgi:predicted aspartyl protease
MIKGTVKSALEAVVSLTVRGPQGQRRRISAVIDTGYNSTLTLPPDVIAELGLP